MDPRSPLYNILIDMHEANLVIDRWLRNGNNGDTWAKPPVDVATTIFFESQKRPDGKVPLGRLYEILDDARAPIVKGRRANYGMIYIREQWRLLAQRIYELEDVHESI